MALSIPSEKYQKESNAKPNFDADNLPNQNAKQAMIYSLRQGAIGGFYGFIGSTAFSLLAHRFCKLQGHFDIYPTLLILCICVYFLNLIFKHLFIEQ